MAKGIFSEILFSFINTVPVDAKLAETHKRQAEVSRFTLEDGTQVSDHIVTHPPQVTIQFEANNQDNYTLSNGLTLGLPTSLGLKAAGIFFLLERLWKERVPFTVVTRHYLYRNMCVSDLTALNVAPKTGTLTGSITLNHIPEKSLTNIKRTSSSLSIGNGTNLKASSIVNSGSNAAFALDNDPTTFSAADTTFGDIL